MDMYRKRNPELDSALGDAELRMSEALHAARRAYPAGARAIVRVQRYGHPVREREVEILGISIHHNNWDRDDRHRVSVNVHTRNLKTGKTAVFYPSIDIEGLPQIRLVGEDA